MNAERTQEMANVLKYAFYSGEDVEHCIKELKRTFGPDVLVNYPSEVEEAFDETGMGQEYRAFAAHGKQGVVRSSINNQMESVMRITETKLRRIIRKTLVETLTEAPGISPGDVFKKGNLGKLPVGVDPSRSTVSASASDNVLKAIDALAIEEDMTQEEINELRAVVNRIADCMTQGDSPAQCAEKILDAGLDAALSEVGYILHDVAGEGEMSDYAIQVDTVLMDGFEY